MEQNFFPQRPTVTPTIYAYKLLGVDSHKGYLKVGYTDRTAKERIDEQLHTSKIRYEIVLTESAMTNDGSCFTDKNVHKLLERKGFHRLNPLDKTDEWFDCSMEDVKAAILSLRTGSENVENRTQSFGMRPEQFRAVEQTKSYFEQAVKEEPNRIPKFLWNAKMRFGKTFASYQLAKKMNLSRILVRFLKTNSGKKGEGMPVVRNPQFYFREGLCWSDINTTFLKCRIKQKSIHDVKSMSIFGVCDKVPEKYILCVINSTLISYYVDTFVNNTQTFQINDARQLPIIVPTSEQLSFCNTLAKTAIVQKIKGKESSDIQKELDDFIENQIFGLV